jgi:iron complex transport system ATP-binding protein
MTQPVLALAAVSVSYGALPVLRDVSLSLRPGRLLGLLGPNGAGKSTVVRVAAGLLPPRAGRVLLDGAPLACRSRREIARRIAVVPQGALLPETFTGWDVVLAGRAPHQGWLGGAGPRDEAVARRALAMVAAEPLAERRMGELSGGERQRLLLARALAQEPAVLLLDEPTAHLDLRHQLAFLDQVRELAAVGLAVLGVFHELNLAAEYCDEIALLREGRIVAQGAPGAVLTAARIAAVYDVAVPVLRHPQSGRPALLVPAAGRAGDDDGGGQP